MIFKFIKAMVRLKWAKWFGYETIAPSRLQEFRYSVCETCPFYADGQCMRCGCLVFAKIMLTTEECPDKRWKAVWLKKR